MRTVSPIPLNALIVAAITLFTPGLAGAGFLGDLSVDYDVARVDDNGYEYSSTWLSVDHVENDFPGPMDSPPLAILVIASDSADPSVIGTELGWWPLGPMHPGEVRSDLHTEFDSPELRAGEYWIHTLLVEDRSGEPIVDSRTDAWSLIWQGGIEAVGPLFVDRQDRWRPYFELADITNRQFGGFSGPLELRFYRTLEDGPAGDAITLCRFELAGLYAGEHYGRSSYSCELESPLPDIERVHVEVRASGSPDGSTASEELTNFTPETYAGGLSWAWVVALSLMGWRFRKKESAVVAGKTPIQPSQKPGPC